METSLRTSEAVSSGHPDKLADLISDVVLDAILKQDPTARVACETFIKTGFVLVGGEITTEAWVDIEDLIRKTLINIGFDHADLGFDGNSCAVLNAIGKQSPEIANGITQHKEIGAGDQGMMFGFACNDTPCLMPAPIYYAQKLMQQQHNLYINRKLPWLRPDAKSQVTIKYIDKKPNLVDNVILSTQHSPEIKLKDLQEAILEEIIKPIIPANMLNKDTTYFLNPSGSFCLGGPAADCGLTGRKLMVDTYGSACRHGGGAFSGKDPTKVDRSAAYYARYVAKNIVAAKLADKCEVAVTYAIGVRQPTSLQINTFGTNTKPEDYILSAIKANFDFSPQNIIAELQLQRPIYSQCTNFGHFGREDLSLPWEQTAKASNL